MDRAYLTQPKTTVSASDAVTAQVKALLYDLYRIDYGLERGYSLQKRRGTLGLVGIC